MLPCYKIKSFIITIYVQLHRVDLTYDHKEMYIVLKMVSTIFLLDANIENKIQSNVTGPCCPTGFVKSRFQTYKISHVNTYLYVKYFDNFSTFSIYTFEYSHIRNTVSAIGNCFSK